MNIIYPMRAFIGATRNKTYRSRQLLRAKALYRFLEENGLARGALLMADGEPDQTRDIMPTDLTDEGNELADRALMKWFAFNDRTMNTESVDLLLKELTKMRTAK